MNLLEVQGLRKTYPAFRLEDVSFSVPEGAVMGLIGPCGVPDDLLRGGVRQVRGLLAAAAGGEDRA